jgi:hypothetical protein
VLCFDDCRLLLVGTTWRYYFVSSERNFPRGARGICRQAFPVDLIAFYCTIVSTSIKVCGCCAREGWNSRASSCVGFIDGTVIGISRPGNSFQQRAAYNGHKRKHALKFQALMSPDGLILHAAGPLEGRRHDWTLYMRSGLDEELEGGLCIAYTQYCIYGDSGYNRRAWMEISFAGTRRKFCNVIMSSDSVVAFSRTSSFTGALWTSRGKCAQATHPLAPCILQQCCCITFETAVILELSRGT